MIHKAAGKLGLRIPEDISIISFDNPISMYDEFSFFSYVEQSGEKIGGEAARMIVSVIENQQTQAAAGLPYQKIIIEPSLMLHESTGPRAAIKMN